MTSVGKYFNDFLENQLVQSKIFHYCDSFSPPKAKLSTITLLGG